MEQTALDIWNIKRILVGEVPWIFLVEVVIRILFIYVLLVASMRLMGKRMAGTMNRNELAALVSLAAAIGLPMQDPARGLIPALIIALIVVGIQRGIALWCFKSKKAEAATQGDLSILIEDGCLVLEELKRTGYSTERIFAQLRSQEIQNLGRVQRAYLESSGVFSLLKQPDPLPGLSIIPEWDQELNNLQQKEEDLMACLRCGHLEPTNNSDYVCTRCGNKGMTAATRENTDVIEPA